MHVTKVISFVYFSWRKDMIAPYDDDTKCPWVMSFTCFVQEDLKDWTIDVLTDALTRVEETARQSSKWLDFDAWCT